MSHYPKIQGIKQTLKQICCAIRLFP